MDLIKEARKTEHKILANIILERITFWVHEPLESNSRKILALAILFGLFETIILFTLILTHEFISVFVLASIIASLIGSLSFFVINWCWYYTFKKFENFNTIKIGHDLKTWGLSSSARATNPLFQVIASIAAPLFFDSIMFVIERNIGLPFRWNFSMYVSLSVALIGMGQGGYWAIVVPLFFNHLEQVNPQEIDLDPLQPARTPLLVAGSTVLSTFTILDALMVSLFLLFFISLHPDFSKNSLYYSFGIVLFSYMVTAWTFLFPQVCLSRFVKRAKASTLQRIKEFQNRTYNDFDSLDNKGLERLNRLSSLYESVDKTPNTLLDFSSIRTFVSSVLVPTALAILVNLYRSPTK